MLRWLFLMCQCFIVALEVLTSGSSGNILYDIATSICTGAQRVSFKKQDLNIWFLLSVTYEWCWLLPMQRYASTDTSYGPVSVPILSSEFGRHAFSYCAPSVWNKLPLSIRSLNRFISFKSHLKSHPFLHKCPLSSCHLATACASDSSLVCMYVCVSFHCELVFYLYLAGRIELIFGMGASFDLSYSVL